MSKIITPVSVAPSLLAANLSELEEEIAASCKTNIYHIDVMDRKFVPQKTVFLDPERISDIRKKTKAVLDVHLMVEEPWKYIKKFSNAGADMLSFHIESVNQDEFNKTRKLIKKQGIDVGVALNPNTPLTELMKYCDGMLDVADYILLMSVEPGKCGQKYMRRVTNKIKSLRRIIDEKNLFTMIEVDGGIKLENSYLPTNAGAHILVSGSGIFAAERPQYNNIIEKMRDSVLIGSDHGGFELKMKIKKYLHSKKIAYYDAGTYSKKSCDYPFFARKVAESISQGFMKRGILVCGTGIGMSITANRCEGVRAAVCSDEYTVRMAREHNDANILCIGERNSDEKKALALIEIFLNTGFSNEERHVRRIKMIDYLKGL